MLRYPVVAAPGESGAESGAVHCRRLVTLPLATQLAQFTEAFQRGIRAEMTAMRERLGAFEIPLSGGERLPSEGARAPLRYAFSLATPNEQIAPGVECSLRVGPAEQMATALAVDGLRITISVNKPVDLTHHFATLVVYPWFLYERLLTSLDRVNAEEHRVDRALALFGKGDVERDQAPLTQGHESLNAGQRAAVQLCNDSSLAFVWGPPKSDQAARLVPDRDAFGAGDPSQ
jgi:hypothetical protein